MKGNAIIFIEKDVSYWNDISQHKFCGAYHIVYILMNI